MNPFNKNISAFLWAIRCCEGTDSADGYRMLFGGELFEGFEDHPNILVEKSGYRSTAAGAYQILYKTWTTVIQPNIKLPDFSPESQDAAAVFLIKNRGAIQDIKEGRIEEAVNKCNKEWASLPGSPYGQPVYEMEYFKRFYQERKERADIEAKRDIEIEPLSDGVEPNDDWKDVEPDNRGILYHAGGRENALERILKGGLNALRGENLAGRIGAKIKDGLTYYGVLPQFLNSLTDTAAQLLKSKRTNNTMETTKQKIIRIIKQPSTKAAITGIITAVGLVFGLNVDAAGLASQLTQSAAGIFTGFFGIYFVYRTVRNLFTDDAKVTANK